MKKSNKILYGILTVLIIVILIFLGKYIHEKITVSDKKELSNSISKKVTFYDTTPISDAYLSDDTSKLSEFDRKIYNKAVEIADKIITDDMTNFDKELAIHDYITTHTTYDSKALSVFGEKSENADNPYGTLINNTAICTGYTTTFKMFMDMFNIPNKLIYAKDSNNLDHAWNIVELDDEWYYVDVTWNDPHPDEKNRPALHKYFNVTEKFLKDNNHIWDSKDLPKAESTKYAYKNMRKMSKEEAEYEISTMY